MSQNICLYLTRNSRFNYLYTNAFFSHYMLQEKDIQILVRLFFTAGIVLQDSLS